MRTIDHVRALGRTCRCRDADMAHRRPLVRGGAVRLVVGGGALAVLLAGSIVVSSEATRLRARLGDLDDRATCLEAESADLARRWMEATSPTTVVARAGRELGLVMPSQPDFVLVAADAADAAADGFLRRVLTGLAGGTAAAAAAPPTYVDGAMVTLAPAAEDAR